MAGRFVPKDYAPKGAHLWDILAHSSAAVQFDHRIGGYLLFLAAWAFAVTLYRTPRTPTPLKQASLALAVVTSACRLFSASSPFISPRRWG